MMLVIRVQSAAWMPVLVDPTLLETYWRHGNYLAKNGWPPACNWFGRFDGTRPSLFKPGVAYFSMNREHRERQQAVSFNNGRHRVRWLLESGAHEVPIALANEHVNAAVEAGLVIRVLQQGDMFDLGFELDAGAMLPREVPNRSCPYCGFASEMALKPPDPHPLVR